MQENDSAVKTAIPNALIDAFRGNARPIEGVDGPMYNGGLWGFSAGFVKCAERRAKKVACFTVYHL